MNATELLTALAAKRPQARGTGPAPQIVDSAYLDALDRATRAKAMVTTVAELASANLNLAIANERFAAVGDIATVPADQLVQQGQRRAVGSPQIINLPEGQHNVSETRVNGNVVYQGVPGKTTVVSPNGKWAYIVGNGSTGTFKDIMFRGSAITGEGNATINAERCDFTDFTRGVNVGFGSGTALGNHNNGLRLSGKITRCRFRDSAGGWAIGFFTHDGLEISDCEFTDHANGIKSNNSGATGRNLKILRCYFAGIRRMWAELQGCAWDFELADCYTERPVLSSVFQENDSCLGFSVIYHGDSTNQRQGECRILRNTIRCPEEVGGGGRTRLAFEHGNLFVVEANYVNGIGTMVSNFMGDSSRETTSDQIGHTYIRNNRLIDAKGGVGYSYGPWARNAHFENNSPNVQLPWDINRPKPGVGGTPTPTPTPTPSPTPTPTPTPSPTPTPTPTWAAPTHRLLDPHTIELAWTARPDTAPGGYDIDYWPSTRPDLVKILTNDGKVNDTKAIVTGLNTGWKHTLRVRDTTGNTRLDLPELPGPSTPVTNDPKIVTVIPGPTPTPTPTPTQFDASVVIPFSIAGVVGVQAVAVSVNTADKTVKVK